MGIRQGNGILVSFYNPYQLVKDEERVKRNPPATCSGIIP